MDNTDNEAKTAALAKIVNELCGLFGTNLESLKKPVETDPKLNEGTPEEEASETPAVEAQETPDSMFADLIRSKKEEVE